MIDFERYGGRRAYLAHLQARAMHAIGIYRSAQNIQWNAIERLVFVCRGNICRSPYASIRARMLGVHAISLGLDAINGAFADESARRNALHRDLNLAAHRSLRFEPSVITRGDLVVAFEPGHLNLLRQRGMGDSVDVTLLGIWIHPSHPHLQDPYGRSDQYFQQCFSAIDRGVRELVRRMDLNNAPGLVSRLTADSGASQQAGRAEIERAIR